MVKASRSGKSRRRNKTQKRGRRGSRSVRKMRGGAYDIYIRVENSGKPAFVASIPIGGHHDDLDDQVQQACYQSQVTNYVFPVSITFSNASGTTNGDSEDISDMTMRVRIPGVGIREVVEIRSDMMMKGSYFGTHDAYYVRVNRYKFTLSDGSIKYVRGDQAKDVYFEYK